jgi:hypothetical protein
MDLNSTLKNRAKGNFAYSVVFRKQSSFAENHHPWIPAITILFG